MKQVLVEFECQVGDYCHNIHYIFDKKQSYWKYCKEFWGITKKDSNSLGDGVFWDDQGMNAISVYSEKEITNEEAETLKRLGVA